jgi:hypothetical protein
VLGLLERVPQEQVADPIVADQLPGVRVAQQLGQGGGVVLGGVG